MSKRNVYLSLLVLLVSGGLFIWSGQPRNTSALAEPPAVNLPGLTIDLIPDQLALAGDVATLANVIGQCTEPWLTSAPTGTILLGVDPASCSPADWDGGSATTEIYLPAVYAPTMYVLTLSWPVENGRGLHSPLKDQPAIITLDGQVLWGKRTTQPGAFGDFYALDNQPLLTTLVVTQSLTHTLVISVPAHTGWDISQIQLMAYPLPTQARGIGYSPYRDCQYPGGAITPTTQNIESDLFQLYHTTNVIRTYAAAGVNHQIPALANAVGLPIWAGAWIDEVAQDGAEIQALSDLANTTDLAGVIVGNEYYLRHRNQAALEALLGHIQYVKSQIPPDVPVTTAEINNLIFVWNGPNDFDPEINPLYRPILDAVDVVMVHIYPFWDGKTIDGAAAFSVQRYEAMRALIESEYGPAKRILIGETGWPSHGQTVGAAVPSPENQERYLREFMLLADQAGVEYMYFDALDELWKREAEGEVGANWGYSYSDRTAKHPFYGVLLPPERLWPYQLYLPVMARSSTLAQPDAATWMAGISPPGPIAFQSDSVMTATVYAEWLADSAVTYVPSGWMGDIESISMYECDRVNPHTGDMAIRASFAPTGTLGWAGVYWQNPENNWGDLSGGYDLTGATRLTFWVRGADGGEVVEFLVGGLGDPGAPYSDTLRPARSTGPIALSTEWEQVEINLEGEDLSRVIGGFAWVASRCYNNAPITFYIDDVGFDFTPNPLPLPEPDHQPVYVYDEAELTCGGQYAPSGWMGDVGDLDIDQAWTGDPQAGTTAISLTYTAQASNGYGWAGIYWQMPENNWGDIDGGLDLSWANKLTFWARGKTGAEKIRFFVGGLGDASAAYPDSLRPEVSTGFVQLATAWQHYTIDLRGQDLSRLIGGFGFATQQCANPGGAVFYLDRIVFEYDPNLPPPLPPGPIFPVYTDAATLDNHYTPDGWMGDGTILGRVSLTECWLDNPHSGQTAIRITYTQTVPSAGWAGIYWLHPAGNWGDVPGGYNLTGADRVTFWARSETVPVEVKFFVGGVGYSEGIGCGNPLGLYPDSICPKIEIAVTLSSTWTHYTLDLGSAPNLQRVVGGFGWSATTSAIIYLDDIVYEFD